MRKPVGWKGCIEKEEYRDLIRLMKEKEGIGMSSGKLNPTKKMQRGRVGAERKLGVSKRKKQPRRKPKGGQIIFVGGVGNVKSKKGGLGKNLTGGEKIGGEGKGFSKWGGGFKRRVGEQREQKLKVDPKSRGKKWGKKNKTKPAGEEKGARQGK